MSVSPQSIIIFEEENINKVALENFKKNLPDAQFTTAANPHATAIIVRTYTKADKKFLSQFPNLAYILKIGVGLDNVDANYCKEKEIEIIMAPGANAESVAEHATACAISLLHQIPAQEKKLISGAWRSKKHMGHTASGKALGLVGCGAIGKIFAKHMRALGVTTVLGYDPYVSAEQLAAVDIIKVELEDVFANSDIVSLHLPLTPETKFLVNKKLLSLMKPTSIIVNTARGEIIKEGDLLEFLETGKIAGAALDVFPDEPNVNKRYFAIQNIILTPHIAAYTHEADFIMANSVFNTFISKLV